MKTILGFLFLLCLSVWCADINETNIPIATAAGTTTNDYVRVLTNASVSLANGKTRLLKIGDLLSLATSGGSPQVWSRFTNGPVEHVELTYSSNVLASFQFDPNSSTSNYIFLTIGLLREQPVALDDSTDLIAIGHRSLGIIELNDGEDIVSIGKDSCYSLLGDKVYNLISVGNSSCFGGAFTNVFDVLGYGFGGAQQSIFTKVNDVVMVGDMVAYQSTFTNVNNVIGIGNSVLYASLLTNSSDIIAIGNTVLSGAAGTLNNVICIGDNVTATNDNMVVIGNSASDCHIGIEYPGLISTIGGTMYPSNGVPLIPSAATLGAGGYWTGNSNGFLVTVYSLDGSTTVMKVLAP